MAMVPMPLDPPCTRKSSPRVSPASMNTLDQTVQTTSGSAAAVASSTPAGRGSSCPAGTATRAAVPRPPPGRRGQTPPGGGGDPLGVAAAGEQRAPLVADRPAGDALA